MSLYGSLCWFPLHQATGEVAGLLSVAVVAIFRSKKMRRFVPRYKFVRSSPDICRCRHLGCTIYLGAPDRLRIGRSKTLRKRRLNRAKNKEAASSRQRFRDLKAKGKESGHLTICFGHDGSFNSRARIPANFDEGYSYAYGILSQGSGEFLQGEADGFYLDFLSWDANKGNLKFSHLV